MKLRKTNRKVLPHASFIGNLRPLIASAFCISLATVAPQAKAQDNKVEVMHQWTSASEGAAMKVLKDAVNAQGLVWQDSAIAGAGGKNLTQTLQARFAAGDPPAASQAHAQYVALYAQAGALGDLSPVAKAEGWDKLISPELYKYIHLDGKIVAVPLNQRRENMLWISKKVLDRFGGKPPKDWNEFIALGQKIQAAGIIPLALGGDDWQEAELWNDILVGQAGVPFYKKAVLGTDDEALESAQMVSVFDTFRKVLNLSDPKRAGVDWAIATGKVIRGQAAMQFQGDWANGEFSQVNMKPGVDYICTSAPGNGHTYVFLTDFLAMFKQPNSEAQHKQNVLASMALSKDVQEDLNLKGGSIPARLDVPRDRFNDCSKQAFVDRDAAIKDGSLIPSFIEETGLAIDARGAFLDVITQFANTPSMTSQAAVEKLVAGVQAVH